MFKHHFSVSLVSLFLKGHLWILHLHFLPYCRFDWHGDQTLLTLTSHTDPSDLASGRQRAPQSFFDEALCRYSPFKTALIHHLLKPELLPVSRRRHQF